MQRLLVSLLLIALVAITVQLTSLSSSANPDSVRAQRKLDTLLKKMPPIVHETCVKPLALLFDIDKAKTKLKSVRWIGHDEVKVTYSCSFPDPQDVPKLSSPIILSFRLRYYAGQWTAIEFWANHPGFPGATLMMLIDEAATEQ